MPALRPHIAFLLVLVLAASSGASPSAARTLEGTTTVFGHAEVIDGDTLDLGTTRIRLFGIDAPESALTCTTAGGGEWACGRAARRRWRA